MRVEVLFALLLGIGLMVSSCGHRHDGYRDGYRGGYGAPRGYDGGQRPYGNRRW